MVDRGNFTNLMNDLTFVDERVKSYIPIDRMTPLSTSWRPDKWSVICGRGKDSYDHIGNRRFRILIDSHLCKYEESKSKVEKSTIVMQILDTIREASHGGGFVKQDPMSKRWFEVGDRIAREKIGQQFRKASNNLRRKEIKPSKSKPKNVKRNTTTESLYPVIAHPK